MFSGTGGGNCEVPGMLVLLLTSNEGEKDESMLGKWVPVSASMVWLHSSAKVLSAVFCTAAFIWAAAIVGALEAVPFVVEPWKAALLCWYASLLCWYDDLVVPFSHGIASNWCWLSFHVVAGPPRKLWHSKVCSFICDALEFTRLTKNSSSVLSQWSQIKKTKGRRPLCSCSGRQKLNQRTPFL